MGPDQTVTPPDTPTRWGHPKPSWWGQLRLSEPITDEGRAFGVADEPGHASTPLQVDLAPDGTVTTHEVPTHGPSAPIGFLAGDLAVHWHDDILTVNPLAD